jgi:hypothetical protein
LTVNVILERLGELFLFSGELANDFVRVDIGCSRGGGYRGSRGLISVIARLMGPNRRTQDGEKRESMHFSLPYWTFAKTRRFPGPFL